MKQVVGGKNFFRGELLECNNLKETALPINLARRVVTTTPRVCQHLGGEKRCRRSTTSDRTPRVSAYFWVRRRKVRRKATKPTTVWYRQGGTPWVCHPSGVPAPWMRPSRGVGEASTMSVLATSLSIQSELTKI